MTITYTHEVANARLGGFSSLLLRWKGSVYKLFYKEFIIYISLYTVVSAIYRSIDSTEFRQSFEKLCLQFQSYTDLVPISFVLGFYVSMVVGRWWNQFMYIPWPDRLMMMITSNVHGSDNRGRIIRRTLVRYLNLAQVLTYRSISTAVYKRFPTIQHVIDAGFMTESECKQYENLKTEQVKYWVPCVWFANLLSKVRQEGRIYDDMTYQTMLKEMNDFRGCCGMLFSYDWISIPLVYTQVVTVAVYVYFMSTLLSRQYLDVAKDYPGHEVDLYVPIFTICQFFFYVGWLKVAEQLINPFGEDDDDFEVNSIIDRNLELSYLSVDNMYLSHPKLEKDMYWNTPNPSIPYTAAAASHKMDIFLGSTIDMSVNAHGMQFIPNELAPPEESKNDGTQVDCNHNVLTVADLKAEQQRLLQVPLLQTMESRKPNPQSASKKPQSTLAASIKKHFMNRSLDKEREANRALLSMDFHKSRSVDNETSINMRHDKIIVEERKHSEDDDDMQSAGPDSDDGDSDVGDGSEDDDVHDSISQRRSSLSSEDGSPDNNNDDAPNDSLRSLTAGKHSIGEPEDRPKAKKAKNSSITTLFTREASKLGPNKLKPKRPDQLIPPDFFGPKVAHRGTNNRGRKSPKKKTTVGKFLKRNEFAKGSDEETEEDRRNAQTRTQGLLRISRKKSVQALHRNARRANYPGNAWLRHRYFAPWGSAPYFNPTDYTSMTSGAEDHGKQGNDSPSGSMLSFGTSIPSPRPLRFCYNSKRGKSLHFDSASMSSCLPSPYAKEDFIGSPPFESHFSPRTRQELAQWPQNAPSSSTQNPSMSMPFTEDLKRRLLIVNTNTPSSSTATSPAIARSHMPEGNHQNPFFVGLGPACGDEVDSDNLLMIAPTSAPGTLSFSSWRENLEAIGENPEKDTKKAAGQYSEAKNDAPPQVKDVEFESVAQDADKVASVDREENRVSQTPKKHATKCEKRNISRSKSCPEVPVYKITNSSDSTANKTGENVANLTDSSEDEAPPTPDFKQYKKTSPVTEHKIENNHEEDTSISVSWENECDRSPKLSQRKRSHRRPADVSESSPSICDHKDRQAQVDESHPYSMLTQYATSETAPLLQSHESINTNDDVEYKQRPNLTGVIEVEDTSPKPASTAETKVANCNNNAPMSHPDMSEQSAIMVETMATTLLHQGPVSADHGYYSAKEEAEARVSPGDAFSKIRDAGPLPLNQAGCKALSIELLKVSETEYQDTNNEQTDGNTKSSPAICSSAEQNAAALIQGDDSKYGPAGVGANDTATASKVVVCGPGVSGDIILNII